MASADSTFIATMATRIACRLRTHASTVRSHVTYQLSAANITFRTWSSRVWQLRSSASSTSEGNHTRKRVFRLCLRSTKKRRTVAIHEVFFWRVLFLMFVTFMYILSFGKAELVSHFWRRKKGTKRKTTTTKRSHSVVSLPKERAGSWCNHEAVTCVDFV